MPMPQPLPILRRSQREVAVHYESNGRDALAATLGWSRETLEQWLTSNKVKQHLSLWYHLCYANSKRFNDGVDWINSGENGYFYNKDDLENDLLLMCLGEGNAGDDTMALDDGLNDGYSDTEGVTFTWITQELWARTAWRIVPSNCGVGDVFESTAITHAAKAYGFAIDILCIAFHSLVHRREESVWYRIITNGADSMSYEVILATSLDHDPEKADSEDEHEDEDIGMDDGNDEESDLDMNFCDSGSEMSASDFDEPATPKAKATPKKKGKLTSPKAPEKPVYQVDEWMQGMGDEIVVRVAGEDVDMED